MTSAPLGVDGCPTDKVVDQHVGEIERLRMLNMPVAGQRQNSGRSTAAAVVVPEAGADAAWQAAVGNGVPASVGESGPGSVLGECTEQPKDLCIACEAVTPAVAVALDQLGFVLRVGMRDKKARRSRLVTGHHVGGARQSQLDQVVAACSGAHGRECVRDA